MLRTRYSQWYYGDTEDTCRGANKRHICNYALADLPRLLEPPASEHLILNKFDTGVDPLAVACWTEHILARKEQD